MADGVKPVALGLEPSFGFGDRLGISTPGHLLAWRTSGQGIHPIFAQQSIREMTRTRRTPADVMSSARSALAQEQFTGYWGADADHLKTEADADATLAAGFVTFTIDPSDHVDRLTDTYDQATLDAEFEKVREHTPWVEVYLNKNIKLKGRFVLKFDEPTVRRAAVKYGRAIQHAVKLASYIHFVSAKAGQDFEIELSIDETPHPTTAAEHYIIADQCLQAGMKLVSLAPRFPGEWEKGVDYKGDSAALEKALKVHAAIARTLGPYKLSLHSGSDKLSVYTAFAQATKGCFHVKSSGTTYLEALRVAAQHDPALFRRIVDFSRTRFDADKATYHVSATLDSVAPPADISEAGHLEDLYLGRWDKTPHGVGFTQPGRQILHCTFGSVLTEPALGPALRQVLENHADAYREVLAEHFGKHLTALAAGL